LAGTDAGKVLVRFERHRPEQTLLYKLVEQYYPDFEMQWASEGRALPDYVRQEFDEYLKCGRLERGFLRVQCETCHAEHLAAFSCKRRGFYPSCGARRMAESAALLVDEVLPRKCAVIWGRFQRDRGEKRAKRCFNGGGYYGNRGFIRLIPNQ
jgi:hypothetical protein